jgi:hypothetical protein
MEASHKPYAELIGQFGQPNSRSDDAIKRILWERATLEKESRVTFTRNEFPFHYQGKDPVGGVIGD